MLTTNDPLKVKFKEPEQWKIGQKREEKDPNETLNI